MKKSALLILSAALSYCGVAETLPMDASHWTSFGDVSFSGDSAGLNATYQTGAGISWNGDSLIDVSFTVSMSGAYDSNWEYFLSAQISDSDFVQIDLQNMGSGYYAYYFYENESTLDQGVLSGWTPGEDMVLSMLYNTALEQLRMEISFEGGNQAYTLSDVSLAAFEFLYLSAAGDEDYTLFTTASGTLVPEPSALGIFAAFAAAGFCLLRRRRVK